MNDNHDPLDVVDVKNTITEERQIELIIEEIREVINKSNNEAQAIGTINDEINGATFKACRFNRSGSLTFCVQIEINNSTKEILVKRRFH